MKNSLIFSILLCFSIFGSHAQIIVTVNGIDVYQQTLSSIAEKTFPDDNSSLSCSQVRNLIDNVFKLSQETATNPHLSFVEGDKSHFCEQKLSEARYRLEFAARRIILDEADKQGVIILDQGKLSWASSQIMANLLAEKRKLANKK